MKITKTNLEDCFVIEPEIYKDERGSFLESFNQRIFQEKTGLSVHFIQDNQSTSQYGVVRGLHMQKGEYAQAKLVRVVKGSVLDVVVDTRENGYKAVKYEKLVPLLIEAIKDLSRQVDGLKRLI